MPLIHLKRGLYPRFRAGNDHSTTHSAGIAQSYPDHCLANTDLCIYRCTEPHPNRHSHSAAIESQPEWDLAPVPDVEQLRTSQPGDGAIFLGLEG